MLEELSSFQTSLFCVQNDTVRKAKDILERHLFFSDFQVLEQLTPGRGGSLRFHPGKRKGRSLSAESICHTVTYRMIKVHSVMINGRQDPILSRITSIPLSLCLIFNLISGLHNTQIVLWKYLSHFLNKIFFFDFYFHICILRTGC